MWEKPLEKALIFTRFWPPQIWVKMGGFQAILGHFWAWYDYINVPTMFFHILTVYFFSLWWFQFSFWEHLMWPPLNKTGDNRLSRSLPLIRMNYKQKILLWTQRLSRVPIFIVGPQDEILRGRSEWFFDWDQRFRVGKTQSTVVWSILTN